MTLEVVSSRLGHPRNEAKKWKIKHDQNRQIKRHNWKNTGETGNQRLIRFPLLSTKQSFNALDHFLKKKAEIIGKSFRN